MKPGYHLDFEKCQQCGRMASKATFTPLMPTPATWANVVRALAREIEWYSDPSRCLYGVLPFIDQVELFMLKEPLKLSTLGYRFLARMWLERLKELTS